MEKALDNFHVSLFSNTYPTAQHFELKRFLTSLIQSLLCSTCIACCKNKGINFQWNMRSCLLLFSKAIIFSPLPWLLSSFLLPHLSSPKPFQMISPGVNVLRWVLVGCRLLDLCGGREGILWSTNVNDYWTLKIVFVIRLED